MKKLLLLGIASLTLLANELMLPATPYKELESLVKQEAYFLEVGSEHCKSCQKMGRLLYEVKEEDPNINLFFVNLQEEREVASKLKIQMIPTQLIFDSSNSEVYRHVGVLSKEELKSLMKKYLRKR